MRGLSRPGGRFPRGFNFTRDVVEELAAGDSLRKALTYVDREGIVDRRTFSEVAQDAARWAHLLRTRLDRGDRVLVVLGKVPAWHGAMLGALKGGLVAVPCSDMLRARDLAFRVRHSGARLVVADRACETEVEEMRNQVDRTVAVIYLDEALAELQRYVPRAPTEDTTAGETALILYTSGTTKEPKGVVHTHAYTWAQRAQAEYWLDAHDHDVVWCTAGTGWAKSIWNVLLGPWSHGAEVVLHEGAFDPEERLSLMERLGVTVLCQAPTEYRMLAKLDALATAHLPMLRHAVSAGEPLNPEVIERFQDSLGLTIHDGYGQTENSLLVANAPGTPIRAGSMGLPTPGHDVAVIDDEGHVCPPGVEGDIALIGRPPTLFSGYWDARDETDSGVPRRLVPDGRPRDTRRRRVPVVRRPRRRRDPVGRVQDRAVRGRERAPRAPGGGGERRDRRAASRAGAGREGVRRPAGGERGEPRARRRAPGSRQGDHGPVQVPARDRVRRCSPQDRERQDPPRRASRAPGRRHDRRRDRDPSARPRP